MTFSYPASMYEDTLTNRLALGVAVNEVFGWRKTTFANTTDFKGALDNALSDLYFGTEKHERDAKRERFIAAYLTALVTR